MGVSMNYLWQATVAAMLTCPSRFAGLPSLRGRKSPPGAFTAFIEITAVEARYLHDLVHDETRGRPNPAEYAIMAKLETALKVICHNAKAKLFREAKTCNEP